eukprot:ANDGO_04101.mRNA.1 Obg-like ATPase 1
MPPKTASSSGGPAGGVRFGRVKNTLKMGIVGLPNVGKSSLFNLLTRTSLAAAENFPFCTIEPNEARCPVPDARYEHLCSLWQPVTRYPAFLQVWDIAGLIRGASTGAGLGNAFLSHIGAVDGIFHMVRAFDAPSVIHVEECVDPVRDLETITHELCQKDLAVLSAAEEREKRDVRKSSSEGMKLSGLFIATMAKVRSMLEGDRPVKDGEWTVPEIELIKDKLPDLVTTKPQVYLVNLSRDEYIRKRSKWLKPIAEWVAAHGGGAVIPVSVEWEEEYAALGDSEQAQAEMCARDGNGVKSALPRIITEGFRCLDLIFFITAGEKEVRCWTVAQGCAAPQAAGVIHSDFEKNFIKAEVVAYEDFKTLQKSKGMADVKAAGKYRQEGRTYIVQDGDIIHFQCGR